MIVKVAAKRKQQKAKAAVRRNWKIKPDCDDKGK